MKAEAPLQLRRWSVAALRSRAFSAVGTCLGLLALLCASPLASCGKQPMVALIGADGSRRATIEVEIADTAQKRALGLMFRSSLGRNEGMLFVFAKPRHQVFWMKNTEIPLDLIFADAQARIIGIIANAEPFSTAQLSVAGESQYVLEVSGGYCQRTGTKQGDRLEFLGFTPHSRD